MRSRNSKQKELGDITIRPNGDNLTEFHATFDGPEKSAFLKATNANNSLKKPPKGYFLTKICHPNVQFETGAICVSTLSQDWTICY
jgi:ubiquitin-protein ligase